MKRSVCLIFLTTICIILKISTQNSSKVPGISGCAYFGTSPDLCGEVVTVNDLPPECTSLLLYAIESDKTFKISEAAKRQKDGEFIKAITSVGKPAFLFHGHYTVEEWMEVLACNTQDGGVNAKTEMANLKCFLEQYKLSGLILNNLSIEPNTTTIANFTANLKIYIDEMKKTFPDFGIGMELIGRQVINLYESPNPQEWLDFKVLDSCIDFYVLDFFHFNDCSEEFKIGGPTPINGSAKYTLEKLVCYTTKAGIPKEKTYFGYRTGPINSNSTETCDSTSTKLCASPTLDGFCADNTQSYYKKGVFAKDNGVGFIASSPDLIDDPKSTCKCGTAYPGFHDILAGISGKPEPPVCPLLDKC